MTHSMKKKNTKKTNCLMGREGFLLICEFFFNLNTRFFLNEPMETQFYRIYQTFLF